MALGVQCVGLRGEDSRYVVERDNAHGVGRRLDQGSACHDAGNGAGVRHIEIIAARNTQIDFGKLGSSLEKVADKLGELLRQHGARGVAHGHRLGAGAGDGLDDLRQIGNVSAGGVDGDELDVVGELGALGNGTGGVVDERVCLLALDVFHGGRAHRSLDLQADALRALRGAPNRLDTLIVHLHRNGERAVLHQGGDRLDSQAVHLRGLDTLDLDSGDADTVEYLHDFKLFLEG